MDDLIVFSVFEISQHLKQVVETQIEPGQSVAIGTMLAKITNPEKLKAQLRVPESQARDLLMGAPSPVDEKQRAVLAIARRLGLREPARLA